MNRAKCPIPSILDYFKLEENEVELNKNDVYIPVSDVNAVNSKFINHLVLVLFYFK